MTRYTVVWLRAAQNQLAEIWLNANDRQAISDATDLIDFELMKNADAKGNVFSGNFRILVVPPIQILFRVSELDRLVEVTSAQRS